MMAEHRGVGGLHLQRQEGRRRIWGRCQRARHAQLITLGKLKNVVWVKTIKSGSARVTLARWRDLNDGRVPARRFPSAYLHICLRSGLKSTDSCSNTRRADVIPTIASVNSLRHAYQSTDDNNSSNAPWSLALLKGPFLLGGSVCTKHHSVPHIYTHRERETSLIRISIQGRRWHCRVCLKLGRVCCVSVWKQHRNKPATLSSEANPPSTAAACLTESPKAACLFILLSYYLFIARNPVKRVSCEQPRAGGLFSSLNVFPERSVLF